MPIIEGGIERKSNTHQLELIQQKKSALQRLVKLTINLNRLSQGLQSILVLGKSIITIPPRILNSFKLLSKKLEPLPTDKLQNTLSTTEIKIQNNIKQILEISQKDESELSDYMAHKEELLIDSIEESFSDYVNDFKKKAQTSIAIRIVLKARKAIMSAFLLPVPEAFIKKQIKILDKREDACRKRIKNEMTSIYKEITGFIKNADCPDELKQQLLISRSMIVDNINHFNSGKDLDSMPVIFETIELSTPSEETDKIKQIEKPAKKNPVDEVLKKTQQINIKPVKHNILSRLWEWVTTPMSYSWSDVSKKKEKKSNKDE
ncbi:MAG: hypothetical protein KAQ67_06760 [Gammaproteobacteria bacterium]|nr:hypothetical protein [Gammaproteobacteria bacterium]